MDEGGLLIPHYAVALTPPIFYILHLSWNISERVTFMEFQNVPHSSEFNSLRESLMMDQTRILNYFYHEDCFYQLESGWLVGSGWPQILCSHKSDSIFTYSY